jgi:hypothetical protein
MRLVSTRAVGDGIAFLTYEPHPRRLVLQGLFSRENFRSGTLRARLRKFAFGQKSALVLTLGCRPQGSAPWLPTFTAPAFAGTPPEPRRGDSPYRPCSTRPAVRIRQRENPPKDQQCAPGQLWSRTR